MCLAVPARIISRHGDEAVVDLHGNRVNISTLLVPEAVIGDWVLLHAGFAIHRLEQGVAEQTWSVLLDLCESPATVAGASPEGGCS